MNKPTLYVSTDGGTTRNGKIDCVAVYAFVIVHQDDLESCDRIRRQLVNVSAIKRNKILSDEIDCHELAGVVPTDDDLPNASNNRGELYAFKAALEHIDDWSLDGDIVWVSDSEYSQKSIDEWSRTWVENPKKLIGKANLDLILPLQKKIDELRTERKVTLVHVRSHRPMPDINHESWLTWFLNDRADKLCTTEIADHIV